MEDPAKSIYEQLDRDPDREQLGRFQHYWFALFGEKPMMLREAISQATREKENDPNGMNIQFLEACMDIAGENGNVNARRLGRWISRKQGRIVGNLKIEKSRLSTNAEKWVVTEVASVKSVLSVTDSYADPDEANGSSETISSDKDPWDE
jgi:hypothetical protein